MLQPSDTVTTEYYIPCGLTSTLTESCQLKISDTKIHFNRNIMFILKGEYSTSHVVVIYLNSAAVNLRNKSFTINIMTKYTAAVSWRFASVGNVYKVYYRCCYLYSYHQWLYPTNYINNSIKAMGMSFWNGQKLSCDLKVSQKHLCLAIKWQCVQG